MNMKSLKTQFIGAIAMVLVAAIAMGSSTYAWFSINSKVTATGMNFTTTVQDNLFISPSAHNADKINAEDTFVTTMVKTDYTNVIVEPVSTKTGQDFYYSLTNNVNGDGQVKNLAWTQYDSSVAATDTSTYANAFSQNYGVAKTYNGLSDVKAVGFVDYVYQLKAVAGSTTKLNLTKLDLSYADKNDNAANTSFRAAVFVAEATTATAGAVNTGTNYSVTASSGDANKTVPATTANWIFTSSENGSSATGVNFTTDSIDNAVVTAADTVGAMTYLDAVDTTSNANANKATFDVSTGTHYYKVVVRIWLEGQDRNCNNTTFAKLDDGKWALSTEWTLGNNATPVSFLKVTETATASKTNLSAAVKGTTTQTINNVVYTKLKENSSGSEIDYWTDETGTFGKTSRVYTIVEGQITEVTNIVQMPIT